MAAQADVAGVDLDLSGFEGTMVGQFLSDEEITLIIRSGATSTGQSIDTIIDVSGADLLHEMHAARVAEVASYTDAHAAKDLSRTSIVEVTASNDISSTISFTINGAEIDTSIEGENFHRFVASNNINDWVDGFEAGYNEGYEDGYADGFADGFAAGVSSTN